MVQAIVMEPGDTVARLREIDMSGDPRPLQAVVGGYVDAHELGHQCFLYVPEDPEGRQLNIMATDLVKIAPTRQPRSFMPFAGFQQSIYGTAVLVTSDPSSGQELTPNQKAYDMLAEAGIDVAVELSNGTVLSTNVKEGITDLVWKDKAPDSARSIIDVAFIPDFLLMRREERIAREFDEVAIREMIGDWVDSGTAESPSAGTRDVRLQKQIEVIAEQVADQETATYLRRRLRQIAEEEINKRQPGDGPKFAKRINDQSPLPLSVQADSDALHKLGQSGWDNHQHDATWTPGSLMEVPARVGYGKDWEQSTKDTYRGDVTEIIRKMQSKSDGS